MSASTEEHPDVSARLVDYHGFKDTLSCCLQGEGTYDYLAIVDFEANCIPNAERNPEFFDSTGKCTDDFVGDPAAFKNEVIEFPTVIVRVGPRSKQANTMVQTETDAEGDLSDDDVCFFARPAAAEEDSSVVCEVVDEFHEYVKPVTQPRVTQFCTSLTGITNDMLAGADTFPGVFNRWVKFMHEKYPNALLVTCGDWDFRSCLPAQLQASFPHNFPSKSKAAKVVESWCNVKVAYEIANPKKKSGGMVKLLQNLGLKLEGRHHSGIDDCRNIAKCCVAMVEDHGKGCFFCTNNGKR